MEDHQGSFAAELRRLHVAAGKPSYSLLSDKSGVPRTTISDILNGRFVNAPPWENVRALVGACVLESIKDEQGNLLEAVTDRGDLAWWRRRYGELVEALEARRTKDDLGGRNRRNAVEEPQIKLVIDIGSVNSPTTGISVGEVRFTISNYGGAPIKVVSILLQVLACRTSDSAITKVPSAPIDEYFLFAEIDCETASVELIDRHYLLNTQETDGFFLKISGIEGWEFDLRIDLTFRILGDPNDLRSSSWPFVLEYPSHSPQALLKLTQRKRQESE